MYQSPVRIALQPPLIVFDVNFGRADDHVVMPIVVKVSGRQAGAQSVVERVVLF